MSEQGRSLLHNIFAPIVVAIIVGLASSFFMGQALMTKLETEVVRAKEDIRTNTVKIEATQRQRDLDRESFIRLETKIDLLLDEQRRIRQQKQ